MNHLLNPFLLLRSCAVGSAVAGLFLIFMALVPQAFNREEQIAFWSQSHAVTDQQLQLFTSYFSVMYTFLSIYLLGHFVMWLGYGYLIASKSLITGGIILLVGVMSCFSDFTEYSLRGIMLKSVQWHIGDSSSLIMLWWFIREWSIWLIYLGVIIVGISFLAKDSWKLIIPIFALLGVFTIPCTYLLDQPKVWFVWLIGWHALSAIVQWLEASAARKLSSSFS
jgi:hypothetical protein